DGAQDHRHHAQGVRRRLLRDGEQAPAHRRQPRLPDGGDRRHGPRGRRQRPLQARPGEGRRARGRGARREGARVSREVLQPLRRRRARLRRRGDRAARDARDDRPRPAPAARQARRRAAEEARKHPAVRNSAAVAAGVRLAALALLAVGCGRSPAEKFPPGTLWAGEAASARPLLAGLRALHDTPAADVARDLDAHLAPCRRFLAFCPAGTACDLAASLRCEPQDDLARQADALRGRAGWVLVHRDADRWLVAWGGGRADGTVAVHAELVDATADARTDPWEALLPARAAPASPLLAGRDALVTL